MKQKLIIYLFMILLFYLSGCQTLQDTQKQFKKAIYKKKSTKEKNKIKKYSRKGYLKKANEESIEKKSDSSATSPAALSSTGDLKNRELIEKAKKMTKYDLLVQIEKSEETIKEIKIEKDRAKDELSRMRIEFQKQMFEVSNALEKEKKKNQELGEKIIQSDLEVIKSKQDLEKIKVNLIAQKNIFNSTFPTYYSVKKGDSLWKIAGKKDIYNDSYKWLELFYANQHKLDDKDLIYPGMVIRIPRYHDVLLSNFEISDSAFMDQQTIKPYNDQQLNESES